VVIVEGADRGAWRTDDFRREEMRSFTVGCASLAEVVSRRGGGVEGRTVCRAEARCWGAQRWMDGALGFRVLGSEPFLWHGGDFS